MMNQKLITRQEHHNWFKKVINSDSLEALIYSEKDSNLGVISFKETQNREYEWGFILLLNHQLELELECAMKH